MIEPEACYMDLDGLMELSEAFLSHIVTRVLELHRAELKVIGKDVAKLEVVVAPDAKGERVPIANPMVSFDLSGPAEWRGGVAQPPAGVDAKTFANYILATTLPVENGINRVIVRTKPLSGKEPGVITLKASSPGLPPATITIASPSETFSRPRCVDASTRATPPGPMRWTLPSPKSTFTPPLW